MESDVCGLGRQAAVRRIAVAEVGGLGDGPERHLTKSCVSASARRRLSGQRAVLRVALTWRFPNFEFYERIAARQGSGRDKIAG